LFKCNNIFLKNEDAVKVVNGSFSLKAFAQIFMSKIMIDMVGELNIYDIYQNLNKLTFSFFIYFEY